MHGYFAYIYVVQVFVTTSLVFLYRYKISTFLSSLDFVSIRQFNAVAFQNKQNILGLMV